MKSRLFAFFVLGVLLTTSTWAQSSEPELEESCEQTKAPASAEWKDELLVSLEGHGQFFGIFNLDNEEFLASSLSWGFIPSLDFRLNKLFSFGLEGVFNWGKLESAEDYRLMVSVHPRASLNFDLAPELELFLLAAGGMTYWEAADAGLEDPRLNTALWGWSVRGALALQYLMEEHWAGMVSVGYFISNAFGDDVWGASDGMLVTLGLRWKLGLDE